MAKPVILTPAQLRKIPGHSTKKTVNELKGMVAGLLTEAGLDYGLVKKGGSDMVMIELTLDTDQIDVKRVIHFKLEVPEIFQKMKKGPPKPLPEAGWRFFYDYLARRVASVQLGITDLMTEFTANIVMQLPDGTQGTMGEAIKRSANSPAGPALPFVMEAR